MSTRFINEKKISINNSNEICQEIKTQDLINIEGKKSEFAAQSSNSSIEKSKKLNE